MYIFLYSCPIFVVVPTSDQRFHKLTTKLRHLTFVVLLSMLFLVALMSAVAYLIHTLEALKKSNTFGEYITSHVNGKGLYNKLYFLPKEV